MKKTHGVSFSLLGAACFCFLLKRARVRIGLRDPKAGRLGSAWNVAMCSTLPRASRPLIFAFMKSTLLDEASKLPVNNTSIDFWPQNFSDSVRLLLP